MFGHDTLSNHFKTNFGMAQHHKWSLSELEGMMPWERYIYIDLLQNHLIEEEKKIKDREAAHKAALASLNRRRK